MGQIKLYANGGSRNHGCEAILRSTKKILDKNMCVFNSTEWGFRKQDKWNNGDKRK